MAVRLSSQIDFFSSLFLNINELLLNIIESGQNDLTPLFKKTQYFFH